MPNTCPIGSRSMGASLLTVLMSIIVKIIINTLYSMYQASAVFKALLCFFHLTLTKNSQ